MKPFTIFNRFLTIALASAALLTTSCKKDTAQNPETQTPRLVRIDEGNGQFAKFDYNNAGQVNKITAKDEDGEATIQITYEGNKPAVATTDLGSTKFIYANNKLDVAEFYVGTTKFQQIKINYLNGTVNNIVVSHNINQESETNFAKTAYEYYPNGDVKKETDYSWNDANETFVVSGSTEFEYDDKNNPLLALGDVYQIAFNLVSKHNPVKEIVYNENGASTHANVYTYTYNTNGYPLTAQKKKITTSQPNPVVSQITYIYQ